MRTKNSFLNITSNVFILMTRTIMSFILRTFFIKILGEEYLGISGLFSNILSMLSLAELGIGTAINFSLYKPLAEKNMKQVSVLMSFYKKVYRIIGIVIGMMGLILLPFIPSIVGKTKIDNIILIYLLYLFNTVIIYFISYKDTLILADQKNYKLTNINFWTYMLMYVLQLISLIVYKNFIAYLLIQIIVSVIQRVFINIYIGKEYRQVDFNCKEKIDHKNLEIIKTNVKAMIYHKVGYQLVNCTDNIIISKFVGVVAVGLYTNYLSLTSMVNSLLYSVFNGITASFGNLVVLEKEKTQEHVFNLINFLGFILFGYATICFGIVINPFIQLWVGEKYLVSMSIVYVICINFYITGMRYPLDTVKEASGIYKEDKYIPIIQAIVNLVVSILLAIKLGTIGVLLGTTISSVLLPVWNRPYIVYKYAFKSSPKNYYKNYIINFVFIILTYLFINYVISLCAFKTSFISLITMLIITTIIYAICLIVVYHRSDNFKFYLGIIKSKLRIGAYEK